MSNKIKPLRGSTDRADSIETKADDRVTFNADEVRLLKSRYVTLDELRLLSQSEKEALSLFQDTRLQVRE